MGIEYNGVSTPIRLHKVLASYNKTIDNIMLYYQENTRYIKNRYVQIKLYIFIIYYMFYLVYMDCSKL